MPSIGDLVANLKVDSRQFSKGFANAQKTLARTTKSLKTELDTFGMSRKQIDLYKASQLGATSAQKAAILSLHGQIEAKQKLATATEAARQRQEQFHASIRGGIKSFAAATLRLTAYAGAAAAVGVASIGIASIKMAANMERTAISFEVMTGSAQKAGVLLADLKKMAAKTPFEFTDLTESAKTLMGFGRTLETVMQDLDMLSNIAAGDAGKLQSLALVYGQVNAAGRLMGQDLLQLINVGFNPLNQISAKTGETMLELRKRMEAGLIPFAEVKEAFIAATSAGGLFYQMNEKQSKTLLGKWSTMKDEISFALIEIGESLIKNLDLKGITSNVTEMATTFKEDWVPALEEFIALAPKLLAAFGQIGQGVSGVAKKTQDWMSAWERMTLIAGGIASGTSPEDMAKTLKEMGLVKSKEELGMTEIKSDTTGKSMLDVMPETRKRIESKKEWQAFALAENAKYEQKQFDALKNPAEQMLAGLIRDGIAAVGTGLMSLGPPVKSVGKPTNQVGTLEKNSAEAFEVMRANVSPGGKDKTAEKQLSEAQKQTKILGKLEKKMTGPEMAALQLKIMGIED